MSTTPRNWPRFLPTLTEVVHPSSLARESAPSTPNFEEIVETVMQRVDRVLERRLPEDVEAIVRALVTQQLHSLRTRLHEELEIVVRQAVSEAIAPPSDQQNTKF